MARTPRAPPSSQWQLAYLAGDGLIKIAHLDHPAQTPQQRTEGLNASFQIHAARSSRLGNLVELLLLGLLSVPDQRHDACAIRSRQALSVRWIARGHAARVFRLSRMLSSR